MSFLFGEDIGEHELKLDIEKMQKGMRRILDNRKKAIADLKNSISHANVNTSLQNETYERALEEIDASIEDEANFVAHDLMREFDKLNVFTVQEKVIPELVQGGLGNVANSFGEIIGAINQLKTFSGQFAIPEQYRAVASSIATIRANEQVNAQTVATLESQVTQVLRGTPVVRELNRIRSAAKNLVFVLEKITHRKGILDYVFNRRNMMTGEKLGPFGLILNNIPSILGYLILATVILAIAGISVPWTPMGLILTQQPIGTKLFIAGISILGIGVGKFLQGRNIKNMNKNFITLKKALDYLKANDYPTS